MAASNPAAPSDDEGGPSNARLTRGSIRGHLVSQTAPMIVGIAAIMSIGIVDAYFIGQLGAAQLAAVAFIFPVTQALSSLGVGVMAGIASVVSRALGRGDDDHARGLANLGFLLAGGVGVVLAITLYLLRQPLFELLQAEADLLPLIDAYMAPYALGFFALPFMMGLNGALRAQGAAKRSMAILITMAVTNWILDPILITGAGGAFCTGGDLAEFGTIDNPATAHLIRSAANAAPWFDRLADRITVRVHGAAVGAGAELAAFAGRVEATADAWFSLPEVGMGLIPGAGGTVSIPRRVGRQRAARMCLTGERLDAPTAVAWGLVDELVA